MVALSKYILVREQKCSPKENSLGLLDSAVDTVNERYKTAEVVLVGVDCQEGLSKGMSIAYDSAQGHRITINDEVLLVILERDVALIL